MFARGIALPILASLTIAATSAPRPLHEFDHADVTQNVCAIVVVHANAAIAASTLADDALAGTVARLRALHADDGEVARRIALADVARSRVDFDTATVRGTDETKRLLAIAGDPASAAHPADVRAFARALGRAFDDDRALSRDIEALQATLQGPARSEAPSVFGAGPDDRFGSDRRFPPQRDDPAGAPPTETPSVAALARMAADDLETTERDVSKEETRAATSLDGAVTGC